MTQFTHYHECPRTAQFWAVRAFPFEANVLSLACGASGQGVPHTTFNLLNLCCHNVAVKHNPTEADISKYFWSLVDKNGPLPNPATGVKSKCWLSLGSVTDQGYGRFKAGKKIYMATRYAWREKGRARPGRTHCLDTL
jgi:hypothetical protein